MNNFDDYQKIFASAHNYPSSRASNSQTVNPQYAVANSSAPYANASASYAVANASASYAVANANASASTPYAHSSLDIYPNPNPNIIENPIPSVNNNSALLESPSVIPYDDGQWANMFSSWMNTQRTESDDPDPTLLDRCVDEPVPYGEALIRNGSTSLGYESNFECSMMRDQ